MKEIKYVKIKKKERKPLFTNDKENLETNDQN